MVIRETELRLEPRRSGDNRRKAVQSPTYADYA